MLRSLVLLALFSLPTAALAEPPSDAELEAASAALPMPSLEARLKARAAAWRVVSGAAARFGFGDADVRAAVAPAAPVVIARNDPR